MTHRIIEVFVSADVVENFSVLIFNNRLLNFAHKHKIIHRSQIGFLPGHRTSDHIFTLKTLIDKHVTHTPKGKLHTCYVDVKTELLIQFGIKVYCTIDLNFLTMIKVLDKVVFYLRYFLTFI